MTTTFTFHDVIYQKRDGVARITINRPETYNAFTDITLREMNEALEDAKNDHDVGVVVITGSGRNVFCSGGACSGRPRADWSESHLILTTASASA